MLVEVKQGTPDMFTGYLPLYAKYFDETKFEFQGDCKPSEVEKYKQTIERTFVMRKIEKLFAGRANAIQYSGYNVSERKLKAKLHLESVHIPAQRKRLSKSIEAFYLYAHERTIPSLFVLTPGKESRYFKNYYSQLLELETFIDTKLGFMKKEAQ